MSIYLAGVCSRENNFLFFEDPHSYVRIKDTKQTNGHGARLLPSLLLAYTHTHASWPSWPTSRRRTPSAVVCRSWAGRKTAAAECQSSAGLGQDVKLQPQSVPGGGRVVMRKSLMGNVGDIRFEIKLVHFDEV